MILSKRAIKISQNPLYGSVIKGVSLSFSQWKILADKKLTVSFEASEKATSIVLMDAIAILVNAKSLSNLFTLTYREVENFLRDENENPALDSSLEPDFDHLMMKLITQYLHYQQMEVFKKETFIEENIFWMGLFSSLEGVEFILKEKKILYFLNHRTDNVVSFVISE
jgi:hypothetical protein